MPHRNYGCSESSFKDKAISFEIAADFFSISQLFFVFFQNQSCNNNSDHTINESLLQTMYNTGLDIRFFI